uniref:Ig-like domain-containing protein n=1 Tax=Ursus maritimus TaxID=29073 RepID=A0A452TR70_URSMA
MAWTPVLLVLLSYCTGRDSQCLDKFLPVSCPINHTVFAGSLSQPVLTQPPSLSASLGSSARLTCTFSTGFSVGSYQTHWFQQQPGSPSWYLLRFYSDSDMHQGPGVPRRFSGSKDASANAGVLLISGLQDEDEADYYCAIGHSSAGHSDTHREVGQIPQPAQSLVR